MTGRRIQLTFVAAITGFFLTAGAAASEPGSPLEILELLRNREFAALDERLSRAQAAFERRELSESAVNQAYFAFDNSDPGLEAPLEDWITERPDSPVAWIARSRYYFHRGWIVRGSDFYHETPGERVEAMVVAFQHADRSLAKALELNPKLAVAYDTRIGVAMRWVRTPTSGCGAV